MSTEDLARPSGSAAASPPPRAAHPAPHVALGGGRLPTLTGLRFPAALLVFLFHAALPLADVRVFADDGVAEGFYALTAQAGGLGVTFFFVLSGFILTWSARDGDRARAFWRRRYAKIVPVYLVTWLFALLLVDMSATEVWQGAATLFMVQSWIPDVATNFAVNNPGWSLSTEAFFYLCFPALLLLAKRIPAHRLKYWLAGTVAAIAVTPLITYALIPLGTGTVPNEPGNSANYFWFAYIFPPARLLDFVLGILVARAVMTGRWRDIGMFWSGVLLAASYALASFVPLLYGMRVMCVIPAALLVAAGALADTKGRRGVFSRPAAVWLGEVSFAFYLVHYTVLTLVRELLGDRMLSTPAGTALLVAEVAVSLLISWALYAWVERPLTRRWSKPRRAALRTPVARATSRSGGGPSAPPPELVLEPAPARTPPRSPEGRSKMTAATESAPVTPSVPYLDVVDPAFRFENPEVTDAQERHWYANTPLGRLVLRHAEANDIVRDPRMTHDGPGFMKQNGVTEGPVYDWFVGALVNQDGDRHRRLKSLVNKAFTPRMVNGLRPVIRETADRLAGELGAGGGPCDFYADFADRLPLAVMTELLGVPAKDFPTFGTWSSDIGLVFSLAAGGDIPARVEAAVTGLYDYVDALMAEKAANPADDLISALVAVRTADGDVTPDELRNLVVTMVFAAHDTTRLQLANAMVTFAEHPDQWRLLGERPQLAPQAVEEVMRWRPSSNAVFRHVTEDLEFRGERFARDTMFLIGVQAVQRDPLAHPGGGVFDISVPRTTPVLQFGGGPHYCLGAPLARMELAEALPALATKLAAPSLAGEVTWRPAVGITGPNELPLRFG